MDSMKMQAIMEALKQLEAKIDELEMNGADSMKAGATPPKDEPLEGGANTGDDANMGDEPDMMDQSSDEQGNEVEGLSSDPELEAELADKAGMDVGAKNALDMLRGGKKKRGE